ncbi:MAG: hypothetical protein A2W17_12410 [Planctomycetes bacterium RBG_16_41_13]|nr:MAG: hypothetical protein A2W17_12410 [Planctomycetes bacterium RBG_16_41_13]HIJ02430.1 DEAD/DEAH box helicase family protein [Candidatus Woesearchaeota archaeon]
MIIHEDINLGAKITQQDAERQEKTVNTLLSLLETEPGVILADEVGMGKTFVALATALTYITNANRHKRILILTPSKELKDKWDKDIDTFRISCIREKSPLKKLAKDEGIDSIKDLLNKEKVPILTIPLSRVAGVPKENEYLCYLGAYFRQRGFSAVKRKEMLGLLQKCDLRTFNESMVMTPEKWFEKNREKFLDYETIKNIDYSPFDETIRNGCSEKVFKDACRKIRNQIIPEFAFCIIDEAHNYKNPWVVGYKLFNDEDSPAHTLRGKFEKMLFLTATPFQLGYHELLNIFRMFKAAKTCAKDFDDQIKTLDGLLSNYSKAVERFEYAWLQFSKKSKNAISEEEKTRFLEDCREYQDALKAKETLEPGLRKLIVRNVKPKEHRQIIFGSCNNHDNSDCGIDIPDKDKPLFFSLLRLENEISQVKRTFSGLTDSMATSAYSTLSKSKMLIDSSSEKFQNNPIITKYRNMISELIHPNDETHPKINDVVGKIVERYLKGEKSLVFTFYIKTAESLKNSIKKRLDNERVARLKGITRKDDIDTYIENTQKKFTSPNDPRYLIFKENLLLTHYQSIIQDGEIKSDEGDWKQITQYLGENGYGFKAKKREDYRILLKVMEHHFFKKAVISKIITKQDSIIKRVLEDDYITYGLHITDEERTVQGQNLDIRKYTANEEDINHVKGLKAIQYILKGHNIWSQHKEALQKIDNLNLRRIIQKYIIREITREDLIVEKFISAKYKDEDETWIEVINKIYAEEAIFNKTFKPETLKDRVDRWLKAIVEKYEKIKVGESSEEEIEKFIQNINDLIEIKNDEDVREIHGGSNINRSVYFEAFNSPFRPVVLICTSIGSEGIDLQQECSGVFLYDLGWNPAALEQKIGRVDRIGSKNSRERYTAQENGLYLPLLEIYRPFIKGTRDERMHRVLQNREKWFNFLLGTGKRLSNDEDDENGEYADFSDVEKEEKMFLLPEDVVTLLTMHLSV